jgi:hypothetical protein
MRGSRVLGSACTAVLRHEDAAAAARGRGICNRRRLSLLVSHGFHFLEVTRVALVPVGLCSLFERGLDGLALRLGVRA